MNIENNHDCRIHLVIYFIYGPKPRMIDYLNMKEIQNYANVIPIIGRGDNYSVKSIESTKYEILDYGKKYEIEFFDIRKTLKKLKINDNFFNFLTEGKYGNCPPYYIYYNTLH